MNKKFKFPKIEKKQNLIVFFLTLLLTIIFYSDSLAENAPEDHYFYVMPLGVSGGEFQDNLSAYLVSALDDNHFVSLDAGVLCSAINKLPAPFFERFNIQAPFHQSSKEVFLTDYIKAYLISHAHLDHIAGLVTCSPIDGHKEIMGTSSTLDYLRDNVFNGKIWPNFADEGEKPQLKIYHYHQLKFNSSIEISQTPFTVQAFPLSHGAGYPSTAFLLGYQNHYLLYMGDTGADSLEDSEDIHLIWEAIAPLIRTHRLAVIFMEASYPNDRPDKLLFGHLTPAWLLFELNQLAEIVNPDEPQTALQELPVVVTHIKQGLEEIELSKLIERQLEEKNNLGIHFIIPQPLQALVF